MDRPHGDQKCGFVFGLKDSKNNAENERFCLPTRNLYLISLINWN